MISADVSCGSPVASATWLDTETLMTLCWMRAGTGGLVQRLRMSTASPQMGVLSGAGW